MSDPTTPPPAPATAPLAPLPPRFDPSAIEGPLYRAWLERGLFSPDPARGGRPFVIVLPPPNVTAALHMGHGLNATVQDILIRFERMRGRDALWVPGTDHAGIATQNVVERLLAREGTSRFDLGRERFLQRVWAFVRETGNTILDQLKAIGASCDWSRTRFTLEPELSTAVREVFVRLWEEGLVYRGHRVIHWCPRCLTSLSDEEAEHVETTGGLYHILYPLADGSGQLTVATTRPETMLGDVAVAAHPDDERYRGLIGRQAVLPIAEIPIPVLADPAVDPSFGTGLVKVTPAHDPNDFEIGRRHALQMPLVMTEDARMADAQLAGAGAARGALGRPGGRVPEPIFGLDRFAARKKIVELLTARGLLSKVETHQHAVRRCYRCDTVVEPRLSDQWFVRMAPLAAPALEAYRRGEVRFIPERRGDDYEQWLVGIRDWNISRQLWWGHRIPVWSCGACGRAAAYREDPAACSECGGPLRQDEDVLDTWFSSWLWPFATLGWPEETDDLKRYYPTDVLVTAPEILFFWVARMIMAGLHLLGRVPFHTVYLHGTVRDTQHRRMSKSLGNGIDPLDVVRLYGADALRFTLTSGLAAGTDITLDPNDLATSFAPGRNFTNKLWNAGRLVLPHIAGAAGAEPPRLDPLARARLRLADRWILSRLDRAIEAVTAAFERFRLGEGASAAYHFLWDEFADWYLEVVKHRLHGEEPDGEVARAVLAHCFERVLRLLHPVMPFITDALYQRLRGAGNGGDGERASLVPGPWPEREPAWRDEDAERDFAFAQEVTNAVRALRGEHRIPPDAEVEVSVHGATPRQRAALADVRVATSRLAGIGALELDGEAAPAAPAAPGEGAAHRIVTGAVSVAVHLSGAVRDSECARLKAELRDLDRRIERIRNTLSNRQFTSRAPTEVVEREREKERQWTTQRATLAAKLAALGCA